MCSDGIQKRKKIIEIFLYLSIFSKNGEKMKLGLDDWENSDFDDEDDDWEPEDEDEE